MGGYLNQAKRFVNCEIVGNDFDSVPSEFAISLLNMESVDRIKVLDIAEATSTLQGVKVVDLPNQHLASIVGRKGKAAEKAEVEEEDVFII